VCEFVVYVDMLGTFVFAFNDFVFQSQPVEVASCDDECIGNVISSVYVSLKF
jgi:hypothetical protein